MRSFGVVTVFVFCSWVPAAADVIAICGSPGDRLAGGRSEAPILRLSQPQADDSMPPAPEAQLALWRDAQGFDILLHWGERRQHSLRAGGAEIMGAELGANFIHLLVARPEGSALEHFLFRLDDTRPGDLMWTASSDGPDGDAQSVMLESVCVRPK